MGQYNGKWPTSLAYASKPLITVITSIFVRRGVFLFVDKIRFLHFCVAVTKCLPPTLYHSFLWKQANHRRSFFQFNLAPVTSEVVSNDHVTENTFQMTTWLIMTTYLRKYLHGITQSCHTIIEFGIRCKHGGVLQSQDIVKADVRFTLTAAQKEFHDGDLGSGDRHYGFTVLVLL